MDDDDERARRWELHLEDGAAGRFVGGRFPPPSPAGVRFAEVLVDALGEDLVQHGPEGALRRIDIVDFADPDPLNITLHVLAATDEVPDRFDEDWDPLTWSNNEREFERSRRIMGREDVRAAADALRDSFPPVSDEHWFALYPQYWLTPATGLAAEMLAAALRERGVALAEDFDAESRTWED